MLTKEEVLQNCTIEGTTVKLPLSQLDRKLYQDVAKSLELIGGKWKGGKVAGFIFPHNPTDLLSQIANGEKRNLKKEYQFFATPPDLAQYLVELAEVEATDRVLEPSAGQGAIIKAIIGQHPEMMVDCFEIMPINITFLEKLDNAILIGEDFLEFDESKVPILFDKIIANPPFSKNQDIDHIIKMYDVLKPGGRLVSVASKHWQLSSNKKETAFREWVEQIGEVHSIERGRFKESGTMIETCIIVINKPQ